jgi:hypothetical protein
MYNERIANYKKMGKRSAFEGKTFSENVGSCLSAYKATGTAKAKKGSVKKIQAWK